MDIGHLFNGKSMGFLVSFFNIVFPAIVTNVHEMDVLTAMADMFVQYLKLCAYFI